MSEVFQTGFGALLKAGREEQNLSVADVATKLKLTARQVEALEAEDLSHLPSPVFVRGFVRNYARLVDVDADSLIAPLDVQTTVSETITAPSAGVSFSGGGLRRWVVLPLAGLGLFLLLVAALYHWLRQGEDTLVVAEPAAPAQPAPAVPAPVESHTLQLAPQPQVMADGGQATESPAAPDSPAPTPAAQPAPLPATPAPPAPATPPVPAKPVPAPATAPVPAKPAPAAALPSTPAGLPAPATATAPVTEKPAAKSGAHSLRFEPAQDAWIQVVDGKGNRFSKLVRAGSAESFNGEPPFRLVVGEAARVRMSYDGHVIDLTPFIGQKVARLTLE